ncbi:putative membrane protein [Breznakia sp. PF5-3]|uniref:YibE/F family protein n=1 Tax=unclassified Breznakia TaxID=2623764 RepID=UPI0024050BA0|nr:MULTISPECIES: YibE/F family protein [unclassified Breznakia]MDL2276137.1 YibE/F family protein [Breznakia sp. OttesenSCG-928-G09]MDF9824415.1 putative membrane protein [Breznakia sp. PM6-1]MDF9835144.1 putative membrane protein [Breznakia sp. PF5-3]MDF9838331.1 putative membrane protein [Breznakia sp. PFB2-8]MDF9860347.1 putative membrane protein [Breznakia sp. PH5-24]
MKRIKQIKKYQIILCVFFVVFGVFVFWLNTEHLPSYSLYNTGSLRYEKAEVLNIVDSYLEEDKNTTSGYKGTQELEVEVKTGKLRGEVVNVENYLSRTHNILVEKGTSIIICLDETSSESHISVYNYSRSNIVYLMVALFVIIMIAVGGFKGFKSALGLGFSFLCIVFFTLPLIFYGYSPILVAIISVILISAVTLVLLDGASKKVFVALCSTAIGVIAAGLLFNLFSVALKVSGFNLEDAESLHVISQNTGLEVKHILFAGVLIAAVGAVLDVAMSISSTLNELHEHNPDLSSKELFKSGINVGKDMIGTMSNTLILAYAGSSFSMMILFMAYSVSYHQIINMDYLVLEISQALAGSMGIVLTVPFAAFIGSKILKNERFNFHKPKKKIIAKEETVERKF